MSIVLDETIAAISTPIGEGGIGIVRLSGKDAFTIAEKYFKGKNARSLQDAKSHTIKHGHIVDQNGDIADEVLVSIFRAPNSYTAEDMVEINAHGGLAPLRKILDLLLHAGARMAEPGEFTKRAFLNGRMDLTQAEAVLDTIRAKTDLQLKAAMAQLHGSLTRSLHSIKDDLMKIYAHMEAYLDFPDEHLDVYSSREFFARYESAEKKIGTLLDSFARGEIVREGVLVVIVGKPNVGKSSLLNALLERERALVSEIPGTTRDALEETININGIPVRLVDTAGFFKSEDTLVKASVERTRQYLSEGDLFLFVLDAKDGFSEEEQKILNELKNKKVILTINKVDLIANSHDLSEKETDRFIKQNLNGDFSFPFVTKPQFVSAKTKKGIRELEQTVAEALSCGKIECESVFVTRLRHKCALEQAGDALSKSKETFLARESLEFVILDLKKALDSLREIVGEVYSEDLLDVIFKEFCIGK